MDGITRRQLVLDADFIAETENEVELGTSVWMLPHSIDDTDITYNGKPLSTLHEENKAAQSRTILTNTSPLDMNSQVFSPTARRSSSLLRLEESAERWIRILALREHYSRKKFTTVRGSEQTDNSSSTQNSQICEQFCSFVFVSFTCAFSVISELPGQTKNEI